MKPIIFLLSLCFIYRVGAQNFTIRLPIIQFQGSNIDEINNKISNDYYSNVYIPNFELEANYKKFVFGINSYYSKTLNKGILRESSNETSILFLEPKTFSIFTGRKLITNEKFEVNAGIGYTKFFSNIGYYYGHSEFLFVERNPNFILFWNSLNYKINNKFEIVLNNRFNPMFKSFTNSPCQCPHVGHDRLNLFISQLMIGYKM